MRSWYLMMALVMVCALGCASIESAFDGDGDGEKEIPLSQVPAAAMQAAQGAVEGITLTEAEVEEEDGRTVYDIEGTADGVEYEIEVTADGKVLEIEREDEDEDDEDHDDDED